MTTPLSTNQALAIVNHCPLPLLVFDLGGEMPSPRETAVEAALEVADILTRRLSLPCHERLDGQQLISNYGVAGWRRGDNANSLVQRAAQALSQARSERNARPIAL
jgi:hypothetical protein